MAYSRFVTSEEINAAKAAGWTVKMQVNDGKDLEWVVRAPAGTEIGRNATEMGAWRNLLRFLEHAKEVNNSAIAKVIAERNRQDSKWGEQNHDAGKWSLILTEELGEVAKSQLEGDRANYLTELVQAAAVLVAWLECELRKE